MSSTAFLAAYQADLRPSRRVVLMAVASHFSDYDQRGMLNTARIAYETGYSAAKVHRILSELIDRRYLEVVSQGDTYRICELHMERVPQRLPWTQRNPDEVAP